MIRWNVRVLILGGAMLGIGIGSADAQQASPASTAASAPAASATAPATATATAPATAPTAAASTATAAPAATQAAAAPQGPSADLLKKAKVAGYHPKLRHGTTVFCKEEAQIGTRFTQETCIDQSQLETVLLRDEQMREQLASRPNALSNTK